MTVDVEAPEPDSSLPASSTENPPDNANDVGNELTEDRGGYELRWTRLTKTVQIREASTGLLRSSSISNKSSAPEEGAQDKTILDQVSGAASPGQVLALMGPSGSGKTTLLNVLSGRAVFESGIMSINGDAVTKSSMKRFMSKIAYVKQSDVFFNYLTIRDQLTYTALLRLPSSWERSRKHGAVNEIIQLLRLQDVADSPIMFVSGGEKKRVNIGTELLTDPSVVLLDEPTSGLDSTSAVALLRLLQRLARSQGKTVITSIHQPSSAVFRSFDKLLMLAEGHCVYFGTPRGSLGYLRDKDFACPDGYNAADHWMDLLVRDRMIKDGEDELGSTERSSPAPTAVNHQGEEEPKTPRSLLIREWDDEGLAKEIEQESVSSNTKQEDDLTVVKKYNTSWLAQYVVLTHRCFKNSRSAIFTPINVIKSALLGVVAGLLWFQTENTERTVEDRISYYFFTMTFWVLDSMYEALMVFPFELEVILKERASASYHLSAYFMAKTTSEAPTILSLPFIYMCISFWMSGINNRFGVFVGSTACTLMSVLAGESLGLCIGATIDDMQKAMATATVVSFSLMLLGGFFVDNIPSFINWARYLSPFKYAFDASWKLIFDRNVPCDGSGILQEFCQDNPNGFATPDEMRDFLNVNGSVGFNVGLLLVLILVPRYIAYLALKVKKGGERS